MQLTFYPQNSKIGTDAQKFDFHCIMERRENREFVASKYVISRLLTKDNIFEIAEDMQAKFLHQSI